MAQDAVTEASSIASAVVVDDDETARNLVINNLRAMGVQQIDAFASCLGFRQAPAHWLDWCSGKGHLGRRLAHDGTLLTCIELDPQLVASGQKLSQRLGLAARHHEQDALADDAGRHLTAEHTAVALHACGDLHVRLMQLASAAGCRQLAIAPCCYNRIQTPDYQPLSATARNSALHLSQADLRLPLSETVTAGARVRRQRDQSMARRLAFDLLQRELTGNDRYLPIPSLATSWLDKPFPEYCRDLCALKGLPTPADRDWQALESVPLEDFLVRLSGRATFDKFWKPLLLAKLGPHYRRTSAVFIWTYIRRLYSARDGAGRKEQLGYVRGGYRRIFEQLQQHIAAAGGEIRLRSPVEVLTRTRRGAP